MTPEEKWQRLTNPTCVSDWGLSMTLEEIKQVPAAVTEVLSYLPLQHQQIFNQETA